MISLAVGTVPGLALPMGQIGTTTAQTEQATPLALETLPPGFSLTMLAEYNVPASDSGSMLLVEQLVVAPQQVTQEIETQTTEMVFAQRGNVVLTDEYGVAAIVREGTAITVAASTLSHRYTLRNDGVEPSVVLRLNLFSQLVLPD
ncbi:MAG: hypothetical protein ACR2OO_06800 [Thermomicrobiales bacterium]